MIQFTLKIADFAIGVEAIYETTREYCKDYLWGGNVDFTICITPFDIEFEREKNARAAQFDTSVTRTPSDEHLEVISLQRKLSEKLFDYNTLLFHGSAIAFDGVAYLFTAKSGTGKSTHTRLWREVFGERVVMVNDDKPFLTVTDGEVVAHGSPWNGKHRLGNNISVPLKAICILKRGTDNRIDEISAKEALFMLLQQSNRPSDPLMMPKYMEIIDGLCQKVKFYTLACNMNPEAAEVAFRGMHNYKQNLLKD